MNEVDKLVKLNEKIERVLNNFLEEYHLNFGNGYVEIGDDYVGVCVEAPNHSTIYISFDEELEKLRDILEDNKSYISDVDIFYEFIPEIKETMYNFDTDETSLQEDAEYFRFIASQI